MDPNANLREQEDILARSTRRDANGTNHGTVPTRDDYRRLGELRQALYDWIRAGGFEPDWTLGPVARHYYGR